MGEFFGAFKELRDKVAAIDQHVLINTIVSRPEYRDFIINRNTEVQLFELNIDSEGVKLVSNRGRGYSDLTLLIAEQEGRPKRGRNRVDLHDSGEYYESHAVSIPNLKADYFEMLSDPLKGDTDLIEEWGPVLGLDPVSMELLALFIAEAFIPLFIEEL